MKIGIVKKMVIGITAVSMMTYGTSAVCIFVLKAWIAPQMTDWLYMSIIMAMGVFWTGFLGWLAARWLVSPLLRLTAAVDEAAGGNLTMTIPIHRGNDELSTLSLSFNQMIENLRQIITDISSNASFTNLNASTLSSALQQLRSRSKQQLLPLTIFPKEPISRHYLPTIPLRLSRRSPRPLMM